MRIAALHKELHKFNLNAMLTVTIDKEIVMESVCDNCSTNFIKTRKNHRFCSRACSLQGTQREYRHKDKAGTLFRNAKWRANKHGLEFSITKDDINSVLVSVCPLLNIPLQISEERHSDNSYTLDRIEPHLGYTPTNIQVISYRANRIKSDSTLEELKLMIENWENSNA